MLRGSRLSSSSRDSPDPSESPVASALPPGGKAGTARGRGAPLGGGGTRRALCGKGQEGPGRRGKDRERSHRSGAGEPRRPAPSGLSCRINRITRVRRHPFGALREELRGILRGGSGRASWVYRVRLAWGAGAEGCGCLSWTRREGRPVAGPGKTFRLVWKAKASGAEPSWLESEGWAGTCGGAPEAAFRPSGSLPSLPRLLPLSARDYLPLAARRGTRRLQRSPRGESPAPGARLG